MYFSLIHPLSRSANGMKKLTSNQVEQIDWWSTSNLKTSRRFCDVRCQRCLMFVLFPRLFPSYRRSKSEMKYVESMLPIIQRVKISFYTNLTRKIRCFSFPPFQLPSVFDRNPIVYMFVSLYLTASRIKRK